jgi:hypothetical protein
MSGSKETDGQDEPGVMGFPGRFFYESFYRGFFRVSVFNTI